MDLTVREYNGRKKNNEVSYFLIFIDIVRMVKYTNMRWTCSTNGKLIMRKNFGRNVPREQTSKRK
jgi:hypothetical protein